METDTCPNADPNQQFNLLVVPPVRRPGAAIAWPGPPLAGLAAAGTAEIIHRL